MREIATVPVFTIWTVMFVGEFTVSEMKLRASLPGQGSGPKAPESPGP